MNGNESPTSNINTDIELPVMEQFYTIQGEGFHQGKAAYFIRLAGCDVGCTWCDVKESWDANEHEIIPIESLKESLEESKAEIVVVTGGEPTIYQLDALTSMIKSLGKKCHLETSGAYAITGSWDWVCISPKRFKKALEENLSKGDELKVIVAHANDFRYAQNYAEKMTNDCKLYLQAEWSVSNKVMPQIVSFVKNNPNFQISLQSHKFINVP